jgi:cytochrome c553
MMKYNLFGIFIFLLLGCSPPDNTPKAIAENAAVAEKVKVCIACHGVDGKQGKVNVPQLGGRTYEDLIAAMQRVKETYSPQPLLGHSLSDEDMQYIATYFSRVK